ncbi:MAG: hypothetical protein MJ025_06655 [Victivallaceae bacterium]|nr:hypothetical protein [Victivallaceae bacterium]
MKKLICLAALAVGCVAVHAETVVIHSPGVVEGAVRGVGGAAVCIGEFCKGLILGCDTVVTVPDQPAQAGVAVKPVPVVTTTAYPASQPMVPVVVAPPVPAVVAPVVVAPAVPVVVRPRYRSRYGRLYRDYYYGLPAESRYYY